METVDLNCPLCDTGLQLPANRNRVVCPRCGATYDVGQLLAGGRTGEEKSPVAGLESGGPLAVVESRLAELDELIAEVHSEIEALRSRELSAPLQLGCAFFGLFTAVTVVLAVFMLLGKNYFGSWLFYLCLALTVSAGVARIRRKLKSRAPTGELKRERLDLENGLAKLQAERDRVLKLRTDLLNGET